jgi:hypothetical protein
MEATQRWLNAVNRIELNADERRVDEVRTHSHRAEATRAQRFSRGLRPDSSHHTLLGSVWGHSLAQGCAQIFMTVYVGVAGGGDAIDAVDAI